MRWHYIALLAPLLLLVLQWRRPRGCSVIVLFVAILFAASQGLIDTRIRSLRMHSAMAISALPEQNPLRRRFGLLHGTSMLLLLGQIVAAGIVVGISTEKGSGL